MPKFLRGRIAWLSTAFLAGCSIIGTAPETTLGQAGLVPATNLTSDLGALPPPKGVVTVAVYSFKDQTGQYKQAPDSSFSTAVSQGGASMLVKALRDSRWFLPVEREGLQDLLTERKILRAVDEKSASAPAPSTNAGMPNLMPARLLMEGAVVGYDSNVITGGIGVKYLGIGASDQFRKDQVTVNLRAIDTSDGKILHSITTTKTIYSKQLQPGIYKFISFKELLEAEAGYTYNEPVQLAVQEAIESAVINLVVEGINNHSWVLANPADINAPLIARVREELQLHGKGRTQPTQIAAQQPSTEPTFLTPDGGVRVRDIPLRDLPPVQTPVTPPPLPARLITPLPTAEQARAKAVEQQRKHDQREKGEAAEAGGPPATSFHSRATDSP